MQSWTIGSVLDWTRQFFKEAGIESFKLDSELLLAYVCDCSRLQLLLQHDKPLVDAELTKYRHLIKRRKAGEPVAYLTQQKYFWDLAEPLIINHGVLIPRPDTEVLVELAVQEIQQVQESSPERNVKILELGTGSLALPLALMTSLQNLECLSIDISHQALQVSNANREKFQHVMDSGHHKLTLIQADRFECLAQVASFDFILSNPPYIPSNDIPTLQREVSQHEPHLALDGGRDGLDFYRYLMKTAPQLLKPNGKLLLEIGESQNELIKHLLPESLQLSKTFHDLQNIPRAICLSYFTDK